MKKIFFLYILLISNIDYAQDCPNRIGSLVINSTTFRYFSNICLSCNIYGLPTIKNKEDYLLYKVAQSELNNDPLDESIAYEVKPDFENIKSSYNMEIASLNDSIKVIFIPIFLTNGIYIKNPLLKFKNDNLFYMSASLSKEYRDIILEKYKGKGHKSEEKTTPNTCKDLKFKKYKNSFYQYFFASEENKIRALLTFDLKINKYCEVEINNRIEIFDFDIYTS
ncbi:hypothetical protein [Flavobacterium sp. LM4]|uniref:hypothetical protein n=1 Tax=Flavobacterium sp. LM4 TaxID=1938609 RepID=UPI0009929B6F|nr:hypothetical protein [Flavobacterium sp. LM4]OOV18494.1 hypothetical protein BXU10_01940 [Flavobacterium sp. LM4]